VSSRKDVDALGAFLVKHGMTVVDPPGEYYDSSYSAVYFLDPDGMNLEGMVYKPRPKARLRRRKAQPPPRLSFLISDSKCLWKTSPERILPPEERFAR